MSIAELLSEGVSLMIIGMGSVFVFLTLLVFLVTQMSRLAAWIDAKNPQPADVKVNTAPAAGSADHIAAISAAVHRYRQKHRS
uniref:Probable oxaloacetate decarboxylase gamma chain n=1 Tax=Magnetococcus massalia (strain MO-1) TaxID=451514 RepID=A0A1S7LMF6_MAGMO|nr:Oxaloacetate decarboxylase gamma chain [Candidatus Magnetococcus massalia]